MVGVAPIHTVNFYTNGDKPAVHLYIIHDMFSDSLLLLGLAENGPLFDDLVRLCKVSKSRACF